MSKPSPRIVVGTMVLLTVVWGTTWAAVRIALEGFPPFAGVAVRFALGAAALAAIGRWRGEPLAGDPRLRWLWPIQAVLTFGVSYGLVYWAEQVVPSGLVAVLFATFPLWVVLLAAIILPQERLGFGGFVGLALGFVGVVVIFSEDIVSIQGGEVIGVGLVMLLAPIASAFGNVAVKRWGAGLNAYALTAVPMIMTAAGMGILSLWLERDRPIIWHLAPVMATVYLAIVGTALTFSLYFWLLGHVSATRMSLVAFGTPLIAIGLGAVAFGEPITTRIVVGSLLVVGGVALTAFASAEADRHA